MKYNVQKELALLGTYMLQAHQFYIRSEIDLDRTRSAVFQIISCLFHEPAVRPRC